MDDPDEKGERELRDTIRQKELELRLWKELDRIRDAFGDDPPAMFHYANGVIRELLQVDASAIMLVDENRNDVELIANIGLSESAALEMCWKAVHHTTPAALTGTDWSHTLGVQIILDQHALGAVVVARTDRAFDEVEYRLLEEAESQLDSAIIQARAAWRLIQRNRELEAIYYIDRLRDTVTEDHAFLQQVLQYLCDILSGEVGYIMLFKSFREQELELRTYSANGLPIRDEWNDIIHHFSREVIELAEMVCRREPDGTVGSIIGVPLILNEIIIGVLGVVNSTNPRGFTSHDQHTLAAIASQVDTAVFERQEKRRVRALFSRQVDSSVFAHLLQHTDADSILKPARMKIAVLFADLRGSTEWCESIEPDEFQISINRVLGRMTEVLFKYRGTLNKYLGDGILAFFNTPEPMDRHAYIATCAGLEMQNAHKQLRDEFHLRGLRLPPLSIGIVLGDAIVGEFGTSNRTEFTAMGRPVNLCSRICSVAKPGQVLISEPIYETTRDYVETTGPELLTLKGFAEPVPVYEVLKIDSAAM